MYGGFSIAMFEYRKDDPLHLGAPPAGFPQIGSLGFPRCSSCWPRRQWWTLSSCWPWPWVARKGGSTGNQLGLGHTAQVFCSGHWVISLDFFQVNYGELLRIIQICGKTTRWHVDSCGPCMTLPGHPALPGFFDRGLDRCIKKGRIHSRRNPFKAAWRDSTRKCMAGNLKFNQSGNVWEFDMVW